MGYTRGEQPLRACELSYNRITTPQTLPTEAAVLASDQSICTDHMVVVTWKQGIGWSRLELKRYGPLSLMPTTFCLHYASECFEGLKAYRGYGNKLRVFRINRNASQLRTSATRISLPGFEPEEVKKLILSLLSIDAARWLPEGQGGGFLYVRPTIIGTSAQLSF